MRLQWRRVFGSEGGGKETQMVETLIERSCTPCKGGIPPLTQGESQSFHASDPIAVGNPTGTEAPPQPVGTPHGEVRAGASVVTVFGGTGFLGRRIVGHLRAKGFAVRVASRHPTPQKGDDPELSSIAA